MTDRELLELAAKAYWGDEIDDVCSVEWDESCQCIAYTHAGNQDHNGNDQTFIWNPHTDDGDSRRLQVALSIDLRFGVSGNFGPYVHARTEVDRGGVIDFHECYRWVSLHPDANAAVRRAVLEVAAAIGQSMP